MDDILLIKIPYLIKKDKAKELHDYFVKQRDSGVIILDGAVTCDLLPAGTKIAVIDEANYTIVEGKNENDDQET